MSEKNLNSKKKKKKKKISPWKEYKLHLTVLVLVIISSIIGEQRFNFSETVSVVIMPLLYAMVIGLGLYLWKRFKYIGKHESKVAEGLMILFMTPLLAKLAVSSGQALDVLATVGPAIILQELGNLGTIFFALPIALLLGFKRESIGMTSSICREPNLGVIFERYGFTSPETRGVLTVFVIGTIIGTVFISLISSLFTALPFHPYALAMASGIGSASMNAAAIAPLIAIYPEYTSTIQAFSGFSNLISFCFGLYITIFVGLPLTEKLYYWLEPKIGRTTSATISEESYEHDKIKKVKIDKEIKKLTRKRVRDWIILLLMFSLMVTIGNYVGDYSTNLKFVSIEGWSSSVLMLNLTQFYLTFIGMLILSAIGFIGILCERLLPKNISSIFYVSLIGILLAMPWSPLSSIIVYYVEQVDLIAIVTVYLGYVGISIGRDWKQFKKLGWRGIIVTCFVIVGTFLGSALIAQAVLVATGAI